MTETLSMTSAPEVLSVRCEADAQEVLTVCFVCTGNTCRSPMAAALLNHLGKEHGIRAYSAGLAAHPGDPISRNAAEALARAGIPSNEENPYLTHTAQQIDRAMLERCDRIIGISASHAMVLLTAAPGYATKISSMPHDIPDPYGGTLADYEACLAQIKQDILALFFPENV